MRTILIALCAALLAPGGLEASGAIHGTIERTDGTRCSGTIRWDRNEAFWDQALDVASKATVEPAAAREPGLTVRFFGWAMISDRDQSVRRSLSVPFGHLRTITPTGPAAARLEFKNGESIDIVSSSSDLGRAMRELIIEGAECGRIELDWDDLSKVTFDAGSDENRRDADRLYGTVYTASGDWTGYLDWGSDEVLRSDSFDGSIDGMDVQIPFGDLAGIERGDGGALHLKTVDGRSRTLGRAGGASPDRVAVGTVGLGTVGIPWTRVTSVLFATPPPSPHYASFDGGRPLRGTVRLNDGGTVRGTIVWDRDERLDWDVLDGEADGLDFVVRFSHIRSVRRRDDASEVTLRDGRVLRLGGTNDVASGHRGIVVQVDDGTVREISWDAVRVVEFDSAPVDGGR